MMVVAAMDTQKRSRMSFSLILEPHFSVGGIFDDINFILEKRGKLSKIFNFWPIFEYFVKFKAIFFSYASK